MPASAAAGKPTWSDTWFAFRNRMLANPGFQRWAATFPLTRRVAARRASALFDISAGFVYSQVLLACVRLRLFEALAEGPVSAEVLAAELALPLPGLMTLLGSAQGLKLVAARPGGLYGLGVHGAAYLGNPAIAPMVEHNAVLYGDLVDPLALLRGEKPDTALSAFWPYARATAPGAIRDLDVAAYSELMSASQSLVASDVLDAHAFPEMGKLLDVGGGEGRFLAAVARRRPNLKLVLFDLPAVAARAAEKFAESGLAKSTTVVPGDFKTQALPGGMDAISLVRVAHDHDDATVATLLARIHDALVPGGTLILAEPLADTSGAEGVGAYFNFYLMAMRSGRARTEAELFGLLQAAGFARPRRVATPRPLLTSLIVAQKSVGPADRTV
jgi:demethylspheroidene O-methyltransferase